MKQRRFLYIFLSFMILLSGAGITSEALAAKKRTKAKSSQTYSKSKKRKSTSKKKKRGSTKKNTRKLPRYTPPAPETPSYDSLTLTVNTTLLNWIPQNLNPGGLRVNSVKPDSMSRVARVSLNENFTYLPVTHELIDSLRYHVKKALPDSISNYDVRLSVANKNLSYYITKVDKLPKEHRHNPPFVTETQPLVVPKKGMENDIIAMWHSHGRYFKPGSGAWMWQRPLLFQTVEDTYTMSYVLPFIVPMLENAGAYVMLPRERDFNTNEVIVDNDTNEDGQIFSQPYYREMNGDKNWSTGEGEGFIYDLPDFRDTENPFENGTYRQIETIKSGKVSAAAWYADIPEDGEYAVYVSYKTLPESASDAHYTVNYSGGSKEFRVNQTMGGGTWIYLGTFPLTQGYSDTEPIVTLSNLSSHSGKIITADAIKIGGGMGNIARSNRRADIYYDPSTPLTADTSTYLDDDEENDGEEDEDNDDAVDGNPTEDETMSGGKNTQSSNLLKKGPAPVFRTSGLPRFLEGARYWLHWAGVPDSIYSPYNGADDYKDDYTSRGHWVNYLAGGSRVLPGRNGLNIPVDLAMALHSDAGKRSDDSFVGTLGIYFTQGGINYVDGTPRINSRMLTDLLMRQITGDIRQEYEPTWTRRSMWDKSYVEARVPEVPTSLIELMSHQNFADMQYGLDPEFRFAVSRAIYKGLARFLSERKDRELVIQPLPVKDFAITRIGKNHYRLSWKPTHDRLEPTAAPHKYIIMERTDDELGFHKIGETSATHFDVKCNDDLIHSFRIIAANDGGVSFPSETLAFREGSDGKAPVLIINGFTRVSAPAHFSDNGRAGFDSENDFGVPFIKDVAFTGYQTEFRRNAGESFGRSGSNYAAQVIAGNSFDYPYIHGKAIADNDRGFVSAGVGAVTSGTVKLSDYPVIDLILGKQKTTVIGKGSSGVKHEAFPVELRKILSKYAKEGGKMFVSGQYVASDLCTRISDPEAKQFGIDVLGIEWNDSVRARSGRVRFDTGRSQGNIVYPYSATLNDSIYIVENPDVLSVSPDVDAEQILTFTDSEAPAGFFIKNGKNRNVVLSVPFEALINEDQRRFLMGDILDFLK